MAFTGAGHDLSLNRNATTGKFDLQWDSTGNPIFADDQSHAVLSLIFERKGEWWADPTGTRGSYLWSVKDDRKTSPSKVKTYIEDALQRLVDAGKILNLVVTVTRPQVGRLVPNVLYSLPNGQTVTLRPALGY